MRLLIPLFSPTTGTWGGLTRVIAVAERAQQAGHTVAFCAAGSLESALQKRGFQVYKMPSATFMGLPEQISQRIEKRSQQASIPVLPGHDFGNIWFVLLISGMAQTAYLRRLVEAERRAAQDFGAEAVFTDLDPGAFLLSEIERLPVAAAYQTPMASGIGSLPWKMMNRAIKGICKDYHLPAQTIDQLFHGKRVLKIIPSIPELEGTDPLQPDVCYVGQLLGNIQSKTEFHPQAGKRYVFVYVGTGAVAMPALRSVLPEIFPAGGNTVCLVGSQSISDVERIGSVEFRPYVPAEEVLPYCDWVICHGGQNTIIQSVLSGVPLLVFPGPIFERRFNARQVQAAGAGVMGELPDFTPAWITDAMADQLNKADCARRLGDRIRSYGGAEAAITAIEQWTLLSSRKR
jgi:UDP:flavonoid glycosyltransferase YjiC (YdhE family)